MTFSEAVMKKLFHDISFWFNRLVHLLVCFDLRRLFPLICLNCWYLLCTPLIFLPFLFCLLTLADPYSCYKRHWQPILPTEEPFMGSAFCCQVREVTFFFFFLLFLSLVATSTHQTKPQLRSLGLFSSCHHARAALGSASLSWACWSQQRWRPLINPSGSWILRVI